MTQVSDKGSQGIVGIMSILFKLIKNSSRFSTVSSTVHQFVYIVDYLLLMYLNPYFTSSRSSKRSDNLSNRVYENSFLRH